MMAALSSKLRSVAWPNGVTGIAHWCLACDEAHAFSVTGKNSSGAQWTWDGDVDCAPSMNIRTNTPDMKEYQSNAGSSVCHYFLRAGILDYLSDCTHAMRGTQAPLPDWPVELGRASVRYMYPPDAP